MFIKLIAIFLIASTSWTYLFPEQALATIAQLKRQIRLWTIHRAGMEAAKEVAKNLRRYAFENGIECDLVEEVLAEHQDMIVERLGKKAADEILGEPDTTERYF
jgi:hypothetical protein